MSTRFPHSDTVEPGLPAAERPEVRFVRMVTHDLRSPIAVTRTLLSVLGLGHAGPLTPEQADLVARADRQLASLQQLVDDLVDLAAARAIGRPDTQREPVPLAASIESACARFAARAAARPVVLSCRGCSGPTTVLVDPHAIDLLLDHLLQNAVAYTTAGEIRIGADVSDGLACITVSDDGIGIPAAARPFVFDEFYRAPNAKAAVPRGTGLGLPIVRTIAERYGGSVYLESVEGRGTTVIVRLPLHGTS